MEESLVLDRYRPLAELGSGGHGSVLVAFDTRMARRVAIKRLPLGRSIRATSSGLAEARTAAMLNHPAIVTVHEWEADDEAAYIVMEYVEGVSIATLLDELHSPLDDDEAAHVVASLTDALDFAHRNGVLHLDIKPGNVLVSRDGRVKLADFGIAALTGADGRGACAGGTIGFMPPEQIRCEEVDDATDQWALAALIYELLTLANPFDADTAEGSLFKAEVAPIPAPSEFAPGLHPGIDHVVLTALSPDPADRYPSVRAFADALRDFLGDREAGLGALAESVEALRADDDESDAGDYESSLGLWDRLAPHAPALRRASAAALCGWLAYVGLGPLGVAAAGVAAALVALVAGLAPGLGVALAALALVSGLVAGTGTLWSVLGLVPVALWWTLRGRVGEGDALAVLAAPLAGAVCSALALPLLLGFVFEPAAAAGAAALAAAAVMLAAAASGAHAPFVEVAPTFLLGPWSTPAAGTGLRALLGPGPLIAIAAWAIAAAVMSFFCRSGTRASAVLGALLGFAVLRIGYALWSFTGTDIPSSALFVDGGIAIAVVAAAIALGPPTRGT